MGPQVTEYDYPKNWGLSYNYEEDATKVRSHMMIATGLGKGADSMEDFGKNMKKEMVDFVSYYRRFPKVAGKPSFSTLYTSINVLAVTTRLMATSILFLKSAGKGCTRNMLRLKSR